MVFFKAVSSDSEILNTVSNCEIEIIFSTIGFNPKIFREPSFSFIILFPTSNALKPLESQYLTWDKSITKLLEPLIL